MTDARAASLAAQRLALRDRLQAQRQRLAAQMTSGAGRLFPRSITMRLLMDRPDLLAGLVARISGARWAGRLSAVLTLLRFVRPAPAIALPPGTALRP